MKFVADLANPDAIFAGTRRQQQPLNRFAVRFMAQPERLMMHRNHEFRAGLTGHRKRLFRIAVRVNPGVVGPDGHNGQIYWL